MGFDTIENNLALLSFVCFRNISDFTYVFFLSMNRFFVLIDLHASKRINFSITYQPKPYQKNSPF